MERKSLEQAEAVQYFGRSNGVNVACVKCFPLFHNPEVDMSDARIVLVFVVGSADHIFPPHREQETLVRNSDRSQTRDDKGSDRLLPLVCLAGLYVEDQGMLPWVGSRANCSLLSVSNDLDGLLNRGGIVEVCETVVALLRSRVLLTLNHLRSSPAVVLVSITKHSRLVSLRKLCILA